MVSVRCTGVFGYIARPGKEMSHCLFMSLQRSIQTWGPPNFGFLSSSLVMRLSALGRCTQRPDQGPEGQGEVKAQQSHSKVGM